ncbi:MAG: hypothetical protein U0175_26910 [Caldilineaceae bacterium]
MLTSLVPGYAAAVVWKSPTPAQPNRPDRPAARRFAQIPAALAEGQRRRGVWQGRQRVVEAVIGEDPCHYAGTVGGIVGERGR